MDKIEKVLVVRKCSCGSPWCPECRAGVPSVRQADRLRRLDWRKTRTIMLSVSRDDFGRDGECAYDFITDRKKISQFIRDLKRHEGVPVGDWVWYLEWNRDGFPHWHLFLETVEGPAGMIGGDVLRRHWEWGEYVYESYIRGEEHWKALTGYLSKRGYFNPSYDHGDQGGKSHQAELPSWALSRRSGSIRKYSGRRRRSGEKGKRSEEGEVSVSDLRSEEPIEEVLIVERNRRTYGNIFDLCGESSFIEILEAQKIPGWDFHDVTADQYGENGKRRIHLFRPINTMEDSACAGRRRSFFRIGVSYRHIVERWPGYYDAEIGGYVVELGAGDFDFFMALYDDDIDKKKAA